MDLNPDEIIFRCLVLVFLLPSVQVLHILPVSPFFLAPPFLFVSSSSLPMTTEFDTANKKKLQQKWFTYETSLDEPGSLHTKLLIGGTMTTRMRTNDERERKKTQNEH